MSVASQDFTPARRAPVRLGDPRREIVIGGAVVAVFFVGFVGWAAWAPLDAADSAQGTVVVTGHRQVVQTAGGGVVRAVHVKEGDQVRAGQVLVEFASSDAIAQEQALATRVLTLKADVARLQAERAGNPVMMRPQGFADVPVEDRDNASRILAMEQAQLTAQLAANSSRHAVLKARIAETGHQLEGYERQIAANARQQALNQKELGGARELAGKGYAPETRVTELERTAAGLEGDAGSQQSEVGRLHSVAEETQLQIIQGDSDRMQQAAEEVSKAQGDLQQLEPQLASAREELSRTQVRAPVDGAVVDLKVNTIGGVAGRGETLMDIVPAETALVVEAHIPPKDINDLSVGQTTQVRFPGLHGRGVPVLHGVIRHLSPDSLVDQRTGQSYYVAEVAVTPAEVARAPGLSGPARMKPGMPAQVTVPLRRRSALQFWMEPLFQAFGHAMQEP